ncbi:MAG: aspartyl beta-hydroxylase [Clostridia bacterium]|nr:aspartyl beta-hydroxylase [Clostridia bacterium]
MLDNIGGDVKKLLLASLGAAAMTAEKAKDITDELVKKGEITLEQGKTLNEELSRRLKRDSAPASDSDEPTADDVMKMLKKLSPEELLTLQGRLDEVLNGDE